MAKLTALLFVLAFVAPAFAADLTPMPRARAAAERCAYRSAVSGHFVSARYAKYHPRTTIRDCVR